MTPFLKLSISFSMKCFDIHTHHVPLSPEYVIRSIAVGRDVMDAHAVHLSVGIHPWFLTEDNVDQLLFTLRQSLGDERVVALGEAGLDKLRAHPYLNFYQAKVIIEHRRKRGEIKSLSQLSLYEEFTGKDLERLSAYIAFD